MNRNKNLFIVGYCGQSGAGKTTTIRLSGSELNDYKMTHDLNIIRELMEDPEKKYQTNPQDLFYGVIDLDLASATEKKNIAPSIYEKFVKSQFQLLNDWSSVIFTHTQKQVSVKTLLQIDRSPIDFYLLTLCGLNFIKNRLGVEWDSNIEHWLGLIKKTATVNTNNFFNAVVITKPWTTIEKNKKKLCDGVRDKYLAEEYTDENWYGNIGDIVLDEHIKTFTIPEEMTTLEERAAFARKELAKIFK